jgi:hypothetical protein
MNDGSRWAVGKPRILKNALKAGFLSNFGSLICKHDAGSPGARLQLLHNPLVEA